MDAYTKMILTVIAVCLTVICLRDIRIVPEAQAQTSDDKIIKVEIARISKGLIYKKDRLLPVAGGIKGIRTY